MYFRTVADLNCCIVNNLNLIPRDIDLVVGIPRSGLLPATIISLNLNLPMTDFEGFLNGRIMPVGRTRKNKKQITDISQCRKILVIDDSVRSGKTIKKAQEEVAANHVNQEIIWASIYATTEAISYVDIYFDICPLPRIFEWHILNHSDLQGCCVVIEGVLCRELMSNKNVKEPSGWKNSAYMEPMLLPSERVGCLLTSKPERYRREMEAWLSEQGIKYNKLVMLDKENSNEIISDDALVDFKAEVYRNNNYVLFIEGDYKQALEIAARTNKPVYCIQNQQFIPPSIVTEKITQAKYKAKSYRHLIDKKLSKIKRKFHRFADLYSSDRGNMS